MPNETQLPASDATPLENFRLNADVEITVDAEASKAAYEAYKATKKGKREIAAADRADRMIAARKARFDSPKHSGGRGPRGKGGTVVGGRTGRFGNV